MQDGKLDLDTIIDSLAQPVTAPRAPQSPLPWLAPEPTLTPEQVDAFFSEKERKRKAVAHKAPSADLVDDFAGIKSPAEWEALTKGMDKSQLTVEQPVRGPAGDDLSQATRMQSMENTLQVSAVEAERRDRILGLRRMQSELGEKLAPVFRSDKFQLNDQASDDDLGLFEEVLKDTHYRDRYEAYRQEYHENIGTPTPTGFQEFRKAAEDQGYRDELAKQGWVGESLAAWLGTGPEWQQTMHKLIAREGIGLIEGGTGGLIQSLDPEFAQAAEGATRVSPIVDPIVDIQSNVTGMIIAGKGVARAGGVSIGAGITAAQTPGAVGRVATGQSTPSEEILSLGATYGSLKTITPIVEAAKKIGLKTYGSNKLMADLLANGVNITSQTAVGAGQQIADAVIRDRELSLKEIVSGALTNVIFSLGDVRAAKAAGDKDADFVMAYEADLRNALKRRRKELVRLEKIKNPSEEQQRAIAETRDDVARIGDQHQDIRGKLDQAKARSENLKISDDAYVETFDRFQQAITRQESGGNYKAKNPSWNPTRGREVYALGKYQVMDYNLAKWTKKHLGKEMTPDEFLADPEAQETVYKGEMGGYLAKNIRKYGNTRKAIYESALDWYGRGKPTEGPSPKDYAEQVLTKFDKAVPGSGVQNTAETVQDFAQSVQETPISGRNTEESVQPPVAEPLPFEAAAGREIDPTGDSPTPVADAPIEAPISVEARIPGQGFEIPPQPTLRTVEPSFPRRSELSPDDLPASGADANQATWYHGSNAKDLSPESVDVMGFGKLEGLIGQGLYLTDDPRLAKSYQKGKGRGKGFVYEAKVDVRNVINFDKPLPGDVFDAIQQGLPLEVKNLFTPEDANLRGTEVWNRVAEGISEEVGYSEAQEILGGIYNSLQNLGYDAITHVGGRATNAPTKHKVLILLDPRGDITGQYDQVSGKFENKYPRTLKSLDPVEVLEGKTTPTPVIRGKGTTVKTGNADYAAEYILAEASDVITSHDPFTFSPDPRYPEGRQTRDYQQAQEKQKVIVNAQKYDPAFTLSDDPTAVNGPTMVDLNMLAAGGNSRGMSTRRMYQEPEKRAVYLQELRQRLPGYGIDPARMEGMVEPVLLRRLNVDIRTPEGVKVVDDLNRVPTYSLDSESAGVAAARRLSNDQMRDIAAELRDAATIREAVSTKGSTDNIRKILLNAGIIDQASARKYITPDGRFTEDGIRLIEGTVMGRLVDDTSLIAKINESVRGKLAKALPAIAQTETIPGWSIRGKVENVIKYIAARGDLSDRDFQAQQDAFTPEANRLSPDEEILRQTLEQRGHLAFKRLVEAYAERAGADLFGEARPEEVLQEFGRQTLSGESDVHYARKEQQDEAGRFTDTGRFYRLKSKRDVMNYVARKFDLPVRYKHIANKNAGGFYKASTNMVRLASKGDLGAFVHETGHFIDEVFKVSDKGEFRAELWELGNPKREGSRSSATDRKGAKYRLQEGIAEYLRYKITDPEAAMRLAPELDKAFESLFKETPDWYDALQWAQKQWRIYQDAGPESRVQSAIQWTEETVPLLQRLRKRGSAFAYTVFDKLYYVRKAVKYANEQLKNHGYEKLFGDTDPYVLARLLAGVDDMAINMMDKGVPDFHTLETSPDAVGLFPSLAKVGNRLEEWAGWMVSKRSLEYSRKGFETPISAADAQAVVDKYADDPIFNQAEADFKKYQSDFMDYMVESEAITMNERIAMDNANANYFPLHRLMETGVDEPIEPKEGKGAPGRLSKPGSLKGVKGGQEIILNPVETLVKNTQAMLYYAHKKRFLQKLADLSEVPGMGRWIEEIPNPHKADAFRLETIKDQLEAMGIDIPKDVDLASVIYRMQKANNVGLEAENIIALPNGPDAFKYYQVHPDLGKSLMPHAARHDRDGMIFRLFSGMANLLRSGVTLTLEFQVGNMIRDAFAYTVLADHFVPIATTMKGMAHLINSKVTGRDEQLNRFFQSGAGNSMEFNFYDNKERLKIIKEKITGMQRAPLIISNPLYLMRSLAAMSEQAPKLGYYGTKESRYIAEGRSPRDARIQAGYEARDLMDFALGGARLDIMKRMVPFFGASLQGSYKFWRTMSANPSKLISTAFVGMTLPSTLLWFQNYKDPDYWELDPYIRDTFWPLFKLQDGTWVLLPKPYEIGSIFATMPEHFLSWMYIEDPMSMEKLAEEAKFMTRTFVPLPTGFIGAPLLEAFVNYDFFRNAPITPKGMDYLPDEQQYTAGTSLLARETGKALGMSPMKIDHIINRMSGSLGKRYVVPSIDMGISMLNDEGMPVRPKMPVLGRFLATPGHSGTSHSTQLFYEELMRLRDEKKRKKGGISNIFDSDAARKLGRMESTKTRLESLRKKLYTAKDDATRKRIRDAMLDEVGGFIKNPAERDEGFRIFEKIFGGK